jgi:putative phosphonate catabolism associated alcohol dehydrogenase
MSNAKAAVMESPNTKLSIKEYPLPEVEKGCILVKITCCTICGSDLHTWQGRRKSPTPIILGHEIVGTISVLGEGVIHDTGNRPLAVGDRITWTLMDSCGKCYYCREKGLMMKCLHLKKYGHDSCEFPPHFQGGFAEYCYLTPGTCVFKIPEELSDEECAPANCTLSTAIAAWEAVSLRPFENVLIQGAGALGVYAAALASHYGCRNILVTDILEKRLDMARRFGATHTVHVQNVSSEEIVDLAKTLSGGFGVDCAMEAAGVPGLIPLGLKCLRTGGRYVLAGTVFSGADFTYDAGDLVFKMITIKGVHNYDAKHLQMAIDFLKAKHAVFPFKDLVTHQVALEDVNEGLRIAASGEALRVAVIP